MHNYNFNILAGLGVALTLMLVSTSANAALCTNCLSKTFVRNLGQCANCGAPTTSGAFKLCPACSGGLNQCEACRTPLSKLVTFIPTVEKMVVMRKRPPGQSPLAPSVATIATTNRLAADGSDKLAGK